MESNCDFIKEIDFYGKPPELYFKGKTKKVTWIGRIFTIIFIFIYIVFFDYKLYRISQRIDITFYADILIKEILLLLILLMKILISLFHC